MVQELRDLLREASAEAPHESGDLSGVLRAGRRRTRLRAVGVAGGAVLCVAAVVTVATLVVPGLGRSPAEPAGVPRPEGPVLHLSDSVEGVKGTDYETLASVTNENLRRANGEYVVGMTDDGYVLLLDGPRGLDNRVRLALVDPRTGDKQWLPDQPGNPQVGFAIELSSDRIVLSTYQSDGDDPMATRPSLSVFDRTSGTWSEVAWPDLPAADQSHVEIGPDDRVYVAVLTRPGRVPEGGWPEGAGGEADDSDAEGDTYHLWSAPMGDPQDLRDEGLDLGSFALTDDQLVYTDRTNGDAGLVHVRELATGSEKTFDPRTGEKCNLLGFGASGDRVVMSQYCGDYPGGRRDDRVQVLSTDGDLVTTIQDSGIDGMLTSSSAARGLALITSYEKGRAGTYVYDLDEDRLVRLSDDYSSYAGVGGPSPDGTFTWSLPVNGHKGDKQMVSRWLG